MAVAVPAPALSLRRCVSLAGPGGCGAGGTAGEAPGSDSRPAPPRPQRPAWPRLSGAGVSVCCRRRCRPLSWCRSKRRSSRVSWRCRRGARREGRLGAHIVSRSPPSRVLEPFPLCPGALPPPQWELMGTRCPLPWSGQRFLLAVSVLSVQSVSRS